MTTFLFSRRGAFLAGVFAASLFVIPAAGLAEDAKTPQPGVISVSAEGVAAAAPDMAVISLTVLREAETARKALDANNAAMAEVLAAMQAEGIADRDLQTGAFSIQPRWFYPNNNNGDSEPPRITGYTVNNTLTVRIRDLAKLGGILDTSVSLGVNQGGNIVFTNDDQETIRDTARMDALVKARTKAMRMTEALGVGLGRITQISENSYSTPPRSMMRAEMAAMAAPAADYVPVAAGENEYRITVSVTWEIDQ
jgi:uncharacterized protein YggE